MERKVLAAVLSNRNWDDLARKLAYIENTELLSPLHKMEDLERAAARGLLDVVFIDMEEFLREPPNGKLEAMSGRGLYVIIISDRMDPAEMRVAMRSGARDYLTRPFSGEDLAEILERARSHRPSPDRPSPQAEQAKVKKKEAEIITFFSTKGGAGKSTLAGNLAIAVAKKCGYSVCLVDLSLQFGDLSLILDAKPRATITDFINSGDGDEGVMSCLAEYGDGVHLLASPSRPEEAELVKAEDVNRVLDALSSQFDYIIIDTAASFSDVSMAALDRSNRVFLIVTPVILGVKNLVGTLDVMRKSLSYPEEKMKVILNRCDSKSGIGAGDIEKLIRKKIDYMVPSDGNVVVPAVNRGVPAVDGNPKSKFSRAVVKLAEEVTGTEPSRPKKSFLKNIFGALARKKNKE